MLPAVKIKHKKEEMEMEDEITCGRVQHQRHNDLIFDASFDSGNLARVVHVNGTNEYRLYIAPDCHSNPDGKSSGYTTWFHFSVAGAKKGQHLIFTIMNSNMQCKLYERGHVPVVKCVPSSPYWRRLHTPVKLNVHEKLLRLTFRRKVMEDQDIIYFAFCFPFSYMETQEYLQQLDAKYEEAPSTAPQTKQEDQVYYHRELLTHSLEGRRVDLLTISSYDGKRGVCEPFFLHPNLHPERGKQKRAESFHSKKKVVFVSARVHPGETPSSFVWKGFLDFILSSDCRARHLRRQFVFKMVPILNPDGVVLGHYRTDTQGQNLNRYYKEPCPIQQLSIYAVKTLLLDYHAKGSLLLYLDLHAHSSKRGVFFYGNEMTDDFDGQVQTQLYAAIASLNSPYLEYGQSNFSVKNMKAKDKRDADLSKEGAGRVALYNETGLIHAYTIECNYNEGTRTNPIAGARCPCAGEKGTRASLKPTAGCTSTVKYTPEVWENVGEALAVSLLDMAGTNPLTRLGGPYLSVRTKTHQRDSHHVSSPTSSSVERRAPTLVQLVRSIRDRVLSTGRFNHLAREIHADTPKSSSIKLVGWEYDGAVVSADEDLDLPSSSRNSSSSSCPPHDGPASTFRCNKTQQTFMSETPTKSRALFNKKPLSSSKGPSAEADVKSEATTNTKTLLSSSSSITATATATTSATTIRIHSNKLPSPLPRPSNSSIALLKKHQKEMVGLIEEAEKQGQRFRSRPSLPHHRRLIKSQDDRFIRKALNAIRLVDTTDTPDCR